MWLYTHFKILYSLRCLCVDCVSQVYERDSSSFLRIIYKLIILICNKEQTFQYGNYPAVALLSKNLSVV